jgi:anti-sigma B factor antagonist
LGTAEWALSRKSSDYSSFLQRSDGSLGRESLDLLKKTLDNENARSNIKKIAPLIVHSCGLGGYGQWNVGQDGVPSKESSMSSQPRRRRLEVEHIGDVTVVNFVDRKILDEQNIQIIGDQLFGLVDTEGLRKLLLNFGNVEYLSSAALGKLITLNKKLQAVGGRLILCNIDPQILEVFEITKLDKFFNIQKEEQAALQAF